MIQSALLTGKGRFLHVRHMVEEMFGGLMKNVYFPPAKDGEDQAKMSGMATFACPLEAVGQGFGFA